MLPANARQIDIDQSNELKEKEVKIKIKWEEQRIENSEGLSILEEIDGLKRTIKEQNERTSSTIQIVNWHSGFNSCRGTWQLVLTEGGTRRHSYLAEWRCPWRKRGVRYCSNRNIFLGCSRKPGNSLLKHASLLLANSARFGCKASSLRFTSERIRALIPNLYQGISIGIIFVRLD